MRLQDQVREFHETFGVPVLSKPAVPAKERVDLRRKLTREEGIELVDELRNYPLTNFDDGKVDICGVAKELADVLYIAYGTALEFGIDLDAVFAVVHASNMSKLGPDGKPVRREDGKILKGPNYEPPDIAGCLRAQGWEP